MKRDILSVSRLRELLTYNVETGLFHWLVNVCNVRAGTAAGSVGTNGYIRVRIDGQEYKGHRLAWFYMYGIWPKKCIDHINGEKHDNRIVNLRDVSHSVNGQNQRKAMSNNKSSGLLGVCFHKDAGKWQAKIRLNYKRYSLGLFNNPEEAHIAYLSAKRDIHPGCMI